MLKNKFFISLCLNILIGILFSFPSFSASNTEAADFSQKCFDNSVICNGRKCISNNTQIFFPKIDAPKIILKAFTLSKNLSVKNHKLLNFFGKYIFDITNLEVLNSKKNLSLTFVNISYLKFLKTIKMLC